MEYRDDDGYPTDAVLEKLRIGRTRISLFT
jgi:hypothetical protein